jgi:hypothetical protein
MSIRPQCSRIVLSYDREVVYGSPIGDAYIDKRFNPTAPPIMDLVQARIDDAADIKGFEWPYDTDLDIITAQDISIPFSFPCSSQLAGLLFALAMGSIDSSFAGDPYTHTLKPQDACAEDVLPSTSIVVALIGDTGTYYLLKGAMVGDLKLVLNSAGRLIISGTFHTDGTITPKPGFTLPSTPVVQDWFTGRHGDFHIGNYGGSLSSIKTKLRTLDFSIANNLDLADGRSNVVNAGIYLSTLRFGARAYTLTAKFDGHPSTNDQLWEDHRLGTVKDVQVPIIITANDSITIRMKKAKIAICKASFDGLRDVLDVTFKAFYANSEAAPVVVTVVNNVPIYLGSEGASASVSPSASISPSQSMSASVSPSASVSASVSPSASASA